VRKTTRFLFVLSLAIAAMLLVMAPVAGAAKHKNTKADVVYTNGKIYTVDKQFHKVAAMAIKNGRFLAAGPNAMMNGFIGRKTTVINLHGKTVLPGLIESHLHYYSIGEGMQQADIFWKSKQETLDAVTAAVKKVVGSDWVTGWGWNQVLWTPPVFPTAAELDAISATVPIALSRVDGHALWVNTKVLALAGITDSTPNPSGGEIVRDAQGHATGVLVDAAMDMVYAIQPTPSDTFQDESLRLAQQQLFSFGITSCVDQGSGQSMIERTKKLYASGELKIRITQMVAVADAPKYYDQPKKDRVGLFGDRYTINGVKILEDGAMGSRGAWFLEPYSDRPGWTGLPQYTEDQLFAMDKEAVQHGFQIATHAIGDAANRAVLNAYERTSKALKKLTKDPRYRIEHAQVIALSDIPRFKPLHVIPSMQAQHATSDMNMAETRIGPERIKGAYAWQKLLKTGVVIPDGSDAPVESANPYWGLYAAVTRLDKDGNSPMGAGGWYPGECMSREQALRSFTIWGAYASFTEKQKGSIEKGKLADFVIVDRDYMKVPKADLFKMSALMTVVGGQTVYVAPGFSLVD
jgi:predicted amidohydrolase YtcJ